MPSPLEQLNNACKTFKETLPRLIRSMEESGSSSKDVMKALCALKEIKQSTRDTFLDAEVYRRRVAEQKDLVEAHHLKLQNLLYEKDHLVREIKRCRGFKTKEMDRIEFPDDPLPVTVDAERHEEHLQRLNKELASRQEMLEQQKQIKEKIAEMDAATQSKRGLLDQVPAEVAAIQKATQPLQELLSISTTSTYERQQDAKQLPTPLYILFCELEAYGQVHRGLFSLSVGEAKQNIAKAKLTSRKHNGAADEPASKRHKTSRSPSPVAASEDKQTAVGYDPAPHTLVVEINVKDHAIKVIFTYIPSMKVVVVDTPKYPNILRNLFADDNGQVHPDVAAMYAFQTEDGQDMEIDFPAEAKARPYLWAQWICGFHYGKRGEQHNRPEPSIRHVVAKLRQRCEAQLLLQNHLDALKDRRMEIHQTALSTWAATAVKTKLDSWTKVTHDTKLFPNSPEGSQFFRAMLHYPNSDRVSVYFEISPAYPKDIPRIICRNEKDTTTTPSASQLKDMEIEVQEFAGDWITEANQGHLLMHQILRLQMCIDMVHLGKGENAFGKNRPEN